MFRELQLWSEVITSCLSYIIIIYIIKLDLCDIAFLCQASPPKALIVQYWSDGHSIMFIPVSNMVNKYIQNVN